MQAAALKTGEMCAYNAGHQVTIYYHNSEETYTSYENYLGSRLNDESILLQSMSENTD
jgi:hypothetical protein